MALGLTQALTEMSARNISWGGGGGGGGGRRTVRRADKFTTFICVDCLEIWEPKAPGTLKACSGL